MENFIDELLQEVEFKEKEQQLAYYDLVLIEIKNLQKEITKNFRSSDEEIEIIKNWALTKNSKLQDRISFLELKLEAFIKEEKQKTIDLPNGTLKFHKKPDKVEIPDMELFLKNANRDLLTVIPEQVKPNLNEIKSWIKTKTVPKGVTIIEGKEEFTYKLKNEEEKDERTTKEIGSADKSPDNVRTNL